MDFLSQTRTQQACSEKKITQTDRQKRKKHEEKGETESSTWVISKTEWPTPFLMALGTICFESFFFRKILKLINFARRSLLSPSSISFRSSNYHSSYLHTPSISLFYFFLLLLLSSLLPLHPFPLQNITSFSNFFIAIIYSPCNTC